MSRWGEEYDLEIGPSPATQGIDSVLAYSSKRGTMYFGNSFDLLQANILLRRKQKAQLIFTSPPFPLNTKKKYGNFKGEEYVEWFAAFAPVLRDHLTENGSIVIEIGNSWEPQKPVMSTTVLKALLAFLERGGLHLCQEFIWYNPARLPSPVEWVNKERIRVKDAFTRVWWMAPTERPKADNRKILRPYSKSMRQLIDKKKYNAGARPSQHLIGQKSFFTDNNGSIPPNVIGADEVASLSTLLKATNTRSSEEYLHFCRDKDLPVHPARMPRELVEFFINFLTDEGDLVLDPFAGSNTTGAVAEELNRRWLSIEARWEYISASIARFPPEAIKRTNDRLQLLKVST